MNYYLNIGSNIGNRRDNIYRAVVALSAGHSQCRISSPIESDPWGFTSSNRFMNVGMHIVSDLTPLQMLRRNQAIERRLGSGPHRDATGAYIDRLVDIDIVAIDDLVIDLPMLQVPHPRLPHRLFFLLPMQELAPTWHHPLLHLTPSELALRVKSEE